MLGELTDASERKLNFGLSTQNSMSFTVRGDHPLGNYLIDGESLVKLYSKQGSATSVLRMVAEIVSAEEVASDSGASIAVTCAEAGYFRLSHRLIGLTSAGVSFGTAASPMARHSVAINAWNDANSRYATGVTYDAGSSSAGSMAAGPWYFKPVIEAITDAAFAADGFDFVFDPLEPSTGSVSSLRTAATIGTSKPEAIFEYGTGTRNVVSYKRQVTRDSLCNVAYVTPPGFPDNTADSIVTSSDATSYAARGYFEALIPSDLETANARQALATEHINLRKAARQRIEFLPSDAAPVYTVDYSVGDTVTARAEHPANSIRFNATFRVYGVAIAIDAEGREQTTLTLISD
jgi:hypothetical protein